MHSIIDSILIKKFKLQKKNLNDCARRPQRPLLLLPLQLTRTRTRARARTHTHTQQATSTTSTPTTPPNAAGPTSPHRRTARRRRPGTATASRRRGACSTCTAARAAAVRARACVRCGACRAGSAVADWRRSPLRWGKPATVAIVEFVALRRRSALTPRYRRSRLITILAPQRSVCNRLFEIVAPQIVARYDGSRAAGSPAVARRRRCSSLPTMAPHSSFPLTSHHRNFCIAIVAPQSLLLGNRCPAQS